MSLKTSANNNGHTSPTALPYTYTPKVSFLQKLLSESRFLIHLKGKLRRFYMVHFRKTYVQNQLALREGQCRQCGTCCNLLITCPMHLKNGHCLAYNICRPQSCKVFPIDQRDIQEARLNNGACGYSFIKKVKQQN